MVQSLAWGQDSAWDFLDQWLGVEFVDPDLGPLIQNMRTPLVRVIPGNGVLAENCPRRLRGSRLNRFDAVIARYAAGAIQLAEFLRPGGMRESTPTRPPP